MNQNQLLEMLQLKQSLLDILTILHLNLAVLALSIAVGLAALLRKK